MAYILISLCSLILITITRLEAFSYHETINVIRKSFEESDYSLGPEFDMGGSFAYVKVKELGTIPPAIRVSLKIFDKRSSTVIQSNKTFDADIDSTGISVTSIKLHPTILTINEQKTNNNNKTVLVNWDPLAYFNPNLYLPVDYAIATKNDYSSFEVFINDNETCRTFNGMCRIEFDTQYKQKESKKKEFFNGDLVWSSMHISYMNPRYYGVYIISGFDTSGNYKLMHCDTLRKDNCTELFSLSNVNSVIDRTMDTDSNEIGICLIENPGEVKSINCLKFDTDNNGKVIFNETVTYKEPMYLLEMREIYDSGIFLVANKYHCVDSGCLHVTISKISIDTTKPTSHRELMLKCSNEEKLFKVSITKDDSINSFVIEYICEGNEEFIFKSATIDDKLIS